jgi:hypothetical protein
MTDHRHPTIRQILSELQAMAAESEARLAAMRSRPGEPPQDEPPDPPPFRPAAGMRPPAPPSEPLDARSRTAA